MCSCNKNGGGVKNLNNGQKSISGAPLSVPSENKVKKTREELLAELRRRISNSTR